MSDAAQFIPMLRDVYGLYPQAKPLADGQIAMFFRAVGSHPLETIRAAFDAHVKDPQRGRFPPLPADVIAQIEGAKADDGRPGADEAWAIAVRSHDEAATVVWTDEIAQAWGIAKAVMDIGDEVGARVAFRDAYNRLTVESRKAGKPARWLASLGLDPEGRAAALEHAQSLGRLLPAPQTALLLEGPKRDEGAMRTLLSQAPAGVRERLMTLRDRLAQRVENKVEVYVPGQDAIDKRTTADLIEIAMRRSREYAEERGIPA